MYFGKDNRLKDMAEQFFKSRLEEAKEVNSILRIEDPKEIDQILLGMAFDLILFEQAALDSNNPIEWLANFRRRYPRMTTPLILCGEERDPVKIMKFIDSGFLDYIIMPPDKPLLIEKINLYTTGRRSKDVRQVYSLQLSQSADLAKPGIVEELSEFDCKVRSGSQVLLNDLFILYSKAFSDSESTMGSVLGRCYETNEHPMFKGQFLATFYFVGATPELLTNIRNSLRKSYVASKAANKKSKG